MNKEWSEPSVRSGLTTHWIDEEIPYTGPELSPHFLLKRFGLRGSAVAAFQGPCDVKTDEMVDWEDRIAEDHIRAKRMVHFLGEFFGMSLKDAVFLQRLWIASLAQSLNEAFLAEGGGAELEKRWVTRSGDDLFSQGRKLSVSIVTASPVSTLLHIGINVDPAGAPVAAIGLSELGIEPVSWARAALTSWGQEWAGMEWACAKVRPVI